MRKPRQTASYPPIPKISPMRRSMWWTQLITGVLIMGVPVLVWSLAGGTAASLERPFAEQLADPHPSMVAAAVVFFAMMALGSTVEYEARRTERRHFRSWYVLQHPDQSDTAGALVVDFVRQILLLHGPMGSHKLRQHLAKGGLWGPPLLVSEQALANVITRRGDGGEWFPWLTERQTGEPYSHVDNPYKPPAFDRPSSRKILEELVRLTGPTTWDQMHANLVVGGPWGEPVPISKVAMGKLLRLPDGQDPVPWLAPRAKGEMYDHVHNVQLRTEANR